MDDQLVISLAEVIRKMALLIADKREADERLGKWLLAALDDKTVCAEMKVDIQHWFSTR